MTPKLILKNLITFIVILLILISVYLKSGVRAFWPDKKIYFSEQMVTNEYGDPEKALVFLEFTENNQIHLISTTEYGSAIKKSIFDYTFHAWDHIGDLYFKTDSLLSFTLFKDEAVPTTMRLSCVQSRGMMISMFEDDIVTYEDTEIIGTVISDEMWFYKDKIYFADMLFNQIDEIDPVYSELIRLFIDQDDIFYQYKAI